MQPHTTTTAAARLYTSPWTEPYQVTDLTTATPQKNQPEPTPADFEATALAPTHDALSNWYANQD
jgi:hypothetical protein